VLDGNTRIGGDAPGGIDTGDAAVADSHKFLVIGDVRTIGIKSRPAYDAPIVVTVASWSKRNVQP
jgi:hypothetical protein